MHHDPPSTVTLVDGRVDLPTRRVLRFGASATLTTLEARVLAYLTARPGVIVPRQTLLEEVWGYQPDVETRAVDQAVWRLRTKVERDARQPRHVLTAHGTGYVFEPARHDEATSEAHDEPGVGGREGRFVGREEELAWLHVPRDRRAAPPPPGPHRGELRALRAPDLGPPDGLRPSRGRGRQLRSPPADRPAAGQCFFLTR